jgi:hypothetical protein
MEQFRIQRYQAIEIPIPSGTTSTQFNIPDQPQLTGSDGNPIVIDAIEAYNEGNMQYSPVSGIPLISTSDFKQCNINLYQGDLIILNNLPLPVLNNIASGQNTAFDAATTQRALLRNLINISWTKSYMNFKNTGGAIGGGTVFVLGVYYSVYPNMEFLVPTKENMLLDAVNTNTQLLKKYL